MPAERIRVTHRELDVLVALCRPVVDDSLFTEPASIRRIAEELVVSEAAVKQHILHLYDKFGLVDEHTNRRVLLANAALDRGVVTAQDLGAAPVARPRSANPAGRTRTSLEVARADAHGGNWDGAYDAFAAIDPASLDPVDLELLGHAAFWSERPDAANAARQRAHAAYLAAGDPPAAARVALDLSIGHICRVRLSVAAGWLDTARRLLRPEPDGAAHARLAAIASLFAIATGAFETVLVETERGLDLARSFGDRDSVGLCLTYRGYALVHLGRAAEGVSLLDEAMALAMSGQVGPLATSQAFCRTIGACVERWDYRRAAEWTDALLVGSERRAIGIGGDCLTHRVAIDIVRGEWQRGAADAEIASLETEGYDLGHVAIALAELGEIHLLVGDLDAADLALRRASVLGGGVAAGMARLQLERGHGTDAADIVGAALRAASASPLYRARLLPLAVEIAVANGDVDGARRLAAELAETADGAASEALSAAAEHATGAVALAAGDPELAVASFRSAARTWHGVGAPYEAARARLGLGQALLRAGSPAAAGVELEAAMSTFERLGARLDVERVTRLSAPASTA